MPNLVRFNFFANRALTNADEAKGVTAEMEKGADAQTLSAEIDGDCGNYLAETPTLL